MEPASGILAALKESGLVTRCSEGDSLRRRKEIVKDIDILAGSNDSSAVMVYYTRVLNVARQRWFLTLVKVAYALYAGRNMQMNGRKR